MRIGREKGNKGGNGMEGERREGRISRIYLEVGKYVVSVPHGLPFAPFLFP